MKINKITDNEDGSATMDCEFTEEEVNMLLEYAVVDILTKQVEREKLTCRVDRDL